MRYFVLILMLISWQVFGARDFGYLKPEDQLYYKNQPMDGLNQQERIDSTVKEINKLHGEIAQLKRDIAVLRAEIQELKSGPKK